MNVTSCPGGRRVGAVAGRLVVAAALLLAVWIEQATWFFYPLVLFLLAPAYAAALLVAFHPWDVGRFHTALLTGRPPQGPREAALFDRIGRLAGDALLLAGTLFSIVATMGVLANLEGVDMVGLSRGLLRSFEFVLFGWFGRLLIDLLRPSALSAPEVGEDTAGAAPQRRWLLLAPLAVGWYLFFLHLKIVYFINPSAFLVSVVAPVALACAVHGTREAAAAVGAAFRRCTGPAEAVERRLGVIAFADRCVVAFAYLGLLVGLFCVFHILTMEDVEMANLGKGVAVAFVAAAFMAAGSLLLRMIAAAAAQRAAAAGLDVPPAQFASAWRVPPVLVLLLFAFGLIVAMMSHEDACTEARRLREERDLERLLEPRRAPTPPPAAAGRGAPTRSAPRRR